MINAELLNEELQLADINSTDEDILDLAVDACMRDKELFRDELSEATYGHEITLHAMLAAKDYVAMGHAINVLWRRHCGQCVANCESDVLEHARKRLDPEWWRATA